MKPTQKCLNMSSFHGAVFHASVNKLKQILGAPVFEDNSGQDKVNFEWEMETDDGQPFTVYDWKEYRELDLDEEIEWHIGGHNKITTTAALLEILDELEKLLAS
jgi:hypothetical protein